ncbi:MAG: CMP/dCMP deaminase zinc-binding protein [Actinomycetia bacterium]|nr:CMP/dCMP deaminase zinc-binding protein [Actinomycetes bacterium]
MDEQRAQQRFFEVLRPAMEEPVPELYFATVRAMGTPVGRIQRALEDRLAEGRYALQEVKLADALAASPHTPRDLAALPASSKRYRRLAEAAVKLRFTSKKRDAVAVTAIADLHRRLRSEGKAKARAMGAVGTAFLFRNLMHHDEVGRLRKVYDRQFFLISIYEERVERIAELADRLAGGPGMATDETKKEAEELVEREEEFFRRSQLYDPGIAERRKFVTNIPKVFQYGDLFLDSSDPKNGEHIDRFVDVIFGEPFITPTRDEIGMADAFSAALQSGNLARQVGAAICTDDGDLIAMGTNDVPKPGGGVYRYDDEPNDHRDHHLSPANPDFARGWDASDRTRREIFTDLVHRMLADPRWLARFDVMRGGDGHGAKLAEQLQASRRRLPAAVEGLVDELINVELVWGAQLFDVLEYGRTMHAEMDAITSAARKGISTRGATLYCTTLPCHECARLIVGAGIKRVIFIEPYEKSRSDHLYASEIRFTTLAHSREEERVRRTGTAKEVAKLDRHERVDFVPYVGISPRRFAELFAKGERKLEDQKDYDGARTLQGNRAKWSRADGKVKETIISKSALKSVPRLADVLDHERYLIEELDELMGKRHP